VLALVIDTSSAAVTAGVVDGALDSAQGGPRVLSEQVIVNARGHGEWLAPLIRQALAEAGAGMADLTAVIAGVGPGPFTGLRVGLVTAAAISDARGIPAYDVCSLDAIAAGIVEPRRLLVATDARRREVYWARYVAGRRVGGPAVAKPADLPGEAEELADAMVGAGARLYADLLGLPLLDEDGHDYPAVRGLGLLAAERVRSGAPTEPLTPLYLRRPDAVEPVASKTVSQ
jgi:tRNA threonylcarbamoyl adenosine modification protein YeaZ